MRSMTKVSGPLYVYKPVTQNPDYMPFVSAIRAPFPFAVFWNEEIHDDRNSCRSPCAPPDPTLRLSHHPDLAVEFVVDTGYTDYLTLPFDAVVAMGLRYLHDISADLADNSTILIPVYLATIVWHGMEMEVPVLQQANALCSARL